MNRFWLWLACLTIVLSWVLGIFETDTFDHDEAHIRVVAEHMKLTGDPFDSSWDGYKFFDKPPLYPWLIVLSSRIIDGPDSRVSAKAARIPSFLFSLLSLVILVLSWNNLIYRMYETDLLAPQQSLPNWVKGPFFPVLVFGTALFPNLVSSAVLFDPIISFFFFPILLTLTVLFMEGREHVLRAPSSIESWILAVFMTATTATKGVIGLILPAFAVSVHCILCSFFEPRKSIGDRVRGGAGQLLGVYRLLLSTLLKALILTIGFFYLLYRKMGAEFFQEFFMTHHFHRATSAMEGHSGPFYYHPAFMLISGGAIPFLVFYLLRKLFDLGLLKNFRKWGFPASWAVAFFVFFGIVKTKLPGYSWPVWPAISLLVCLLAVQLLAIPMPLKSQKGIFRLPSFLFRIGEGASIASLFFLGLCFFVLGAIDKSFLVSQIQDPKVRLVLTTVVEWPLSVTVGLVLAGAFCFIEAGVFLSIRRELSKTDWVRLFSYSGTLTALTILALRLSLVPFAEELMVKPYARIARKAAILGENQACLDYFGVRPSPTVSLNFTPDRVRQCRPGDRKMLLSARWSKEKCPSGEFRVLEEEGYLNLCGPGKVRSDSFYSR